MQIEQTLHELFWNPTDLASLPSLVLRRVIAAVLGILLGQAYVHFGQALSNRKLFARNFIVLTVTTALIISIVRSSVALSLGSWARCPSCAFAPPSRSPRNSPSSSLPSAPVSDSAPTPPRSE